MTKRKREIQKRKKLLDEPWKKDDPSTATPADDVEPSTDQGEDVAVTAEARPMGPAGEGSRIAAPPAVTRAKEKPAHRKAEPDHRQGEGTAGRGWLARNRENVLLGMLVIYVLLLGLGTAGELFEVEWILNLPLFK